MESDAQACHILFSDLSFSCLGILLCYDLVNMRRLALKNKKQIIKKCTEAGVEPWNFGLTGQKINHYTITDAVEAANIGILFLNFL